MNRFLIVILCFLLAACRLHAQQPPLRNFSVKDGLPSGIVYDCLEDKNGFMWFATEAGLARFDGSGFKVFTTADGLTNNIIIQLVEDIDGSIWIFPFGTSPCIYDQRLHKILNEKDYPELAKIGVEKEHMFAYKTATGIATNTKVGFWIFEQRRARKINAPWVHHIILKHTAREILVVGTDSLHAPMYSINYNRKDSEWVKGEKTLFNFSDFWKMGSVSKSMESRWNEKLIMANRFSLNFFRLMAEPGAGLVKEKAIQFTDPVQKLCDSDSLLYVCTTKGVHIYDKDFRFRGVKWPGISISTVYSDKRGNEWICTVDGKGVLLQVNGKTSILNESSGLPTDNIMSVATNNRDVVYTGDVTGNIAALNLYQFPTGKQLVAQTKSWVRQLFYDPNGVLWGFDNTEIIKYDHGKILKYRDDFAAYKALNVTADTILMASVFDLHMFDARLKNREWALNGLSRIICIASTPTYYYIGNNAGLYKVDRGHQKQAIPPALIPLPVTDPVTALVYTPNGLLLAGTSARGLVVLKNDKVLAEITLQKHIQSPGNYTIKKITVNNRRNRVWLATNKGAMAIDYRLSGNDFRYTSHVLAFKDGLADNDVNDIALMGDTVVAATIKGLTIFHDTLSESRLPLRITGV
ncbi:MAG: hypothetical protein JNM68_17000, partial [Dinghuibacter sp.]|nr:hypothetical protein [Dinghuibacter sp.]